MTICNSFKSMKHHGIHWTKNVEYLYTENYKTLLGEIKDLNEWREKLYSWIHQLSTNWTTVSMQSQSEIDKLILKFVYMEMQRA